MSVLFAGLLFFLFGYCTVLTSGQSNGELRLAIDGLAIRGITAGRLQIYLDGQWGNICNGGFGIEEANVACHQLGYDRALSYSSATSDGYGIDDRPTLMNDVVCGNSSLHILQCSYTILPDCDDSTDVSVSCSTVPIWTNTYVGALRLLDGIYPSQGRLEIYLLITNWNTVCDDFFGQSDADTACRQLGYTHASQFDHITGITGSGFYTTDYNCCFSSSQSCIRDCYCSDDNTVYTKRKRNSICTHNEDITLQCDFDLSRSGDAGQRNQCDRTQQDIIVGAIIGGIFGGIILILLIVVGVVFLCIKCN